MSRIRRKHFLVPPLGEPIPIPVTADAVVIGRDKACTIRIVSDSVSRRHAEIRFRGRPERAYIADLNTLNGTRLNGAPVRGERTLASEDVIRIGDVTAVYRVVAGDTAEPPDDETLNSTVPLSVTMPASLDGLTGDARLLPLDGLLGRLTIVRASGRLEVDVDGSQGFLLLEEGQIKEAQFGGKDGAVAIRAIAALRKGQFRFHEHGGVDEAPEVERTGTFAREGATWRIAIPDAPGINVAHVRGLTMIEVLLGRPGEEVEAVSLARLEQGEGPTTRRSRDAVESDLASRPQANARAAATIDAAARRQYEARARELEELIEQGLGGPAVEEELATLARQLGESSERTGSDAERARSSVTHAIKRALAAIKDAEARSGGTGALARHFEAAIATGARPVYRPTAGSPDAWRLTSGVVMGRSPSRP
jgi:pSer/pThr/pTyr-binding forkhead associated (FHA) protein